MKLFAVTALFFLCNWCHAADTLTITIHNLANDPEQKQTVNATLSNSPRTGFFLASIDSSELWLLKKKNNIEYAGLCLINASGQTTKHWIPSAIDGFIVQGWAIN